MSLWTPENSATQKFVCMDVSFCLLCMYTMCMYICIRMLSTVGTGVLICSIIVLYFVILNFKKIIYGCSLFLS